MTPIQKLAHNLHALLCLENHSSDPACITDPTYPDCKYKAEGLFENCWTFSTHIQWLDLAEAVARKCITADDLSILLNTLQHFQTFCLGITAQPILIGIVAPQLRKKFNILFGEED